MLRAKPIAQLNAHFQEAVGPSVGMAEQGTELLLLLRFAVLHFEGGCLCVLSLAMPVASLQALPRFQAN